MSLILPFSALSEIGRGQWKSVKRWSPQFNVPVMRRRWLAKWLMVYFPRWKRRRLLPGARWSSFGVTGMKH